jgi:hypothetical protein
VRGKGIAGSRPSGRSVFDNAIVARVARLGSGAPLSLGDCDSRSEFAGPPMPGKRDLVVPRQAAVTSVGAVSINGPLLRHAKRSSHRSAQRRFCLSSISTLWRQQAEALGFVGKAQVHRSSSASARMGIRLIAAMSAQAQ